MRDGIISLSDEDVKPWASKILSLCGQAGILDVNLLEDEGTRSIPQSEVKNKPEQDRLDSIESVEQWELVR